MAARGTESTYRTISRHSGAAESPVCGCGLLFWGQSDLATDQSV